MGWHVCMTLTQFSCAQLNVAGGLGVTSKHMWEMVVCRPESKPSVSPGEQTAELVADCSARQRQQILLPSCS